MPLQMVWSKKQCPVAPKVHPLTPDKPYSPSLVLIWVSNSDRSTSSTFHYGRELALHLHFKILADALTRCDSQSAEHVGFCWRLPLQDVEHATFLFQGILAGPTASYNYTTRCNHTTQLLITNTSVQYLTFWSLHTEVHKGGRTFILTVSTHLLTQSFKDLPPRLRKTLN